MAFQRETFEKYTIKLGIILSKLRISPNQWTIFSLVPVLIAFYFLIQQEFLYCAAFFALSVFIDVIDGAVARVTGRVTKFGAFLDTVIDRYIEGIILFGLFFVPLPDFYLPATAWLFLAFFGGVTTTYIKAASKEKNLLATGETDSLLQRAERVGLLFVGLLLAILSPLYLTYVLVLIAVLTNFSALQKFWNAWRTSKKRFTDRF
jgi:phosphatidylglycerophosphate synthase